MGRSKRSRKIKSANKLLKKQRKQLHAMYIAQLAMVSVAASVSIKMVQAHQFKKAGKDSEVIACVNQCVEEVKDMREQCKSLKTTNLRNPDGINISEII